MITLDDVEYYTVQVPTNNCAPKGFPNCHFSEDVVGCFDRPRSDICSPADSSQPFVIFLTRDEYLQHVARKLTS